MKAVTGSFDHQTEVVAFACATATVSGLLTPVRYITTSTSTGRCSRAAQHPHDQEAVAAVSQNLRNGGALPMDRIDENSQVQEDPGVDEQAPGVCRSGSSPPDAGLVCPAWEDEPVGQLSSRMMKAVQDATAKATGDVMKPRNGAGHDGDQRPPAAER